MAFPILGTPRPQFSDSTGVLAAGTVQVLNPADDTDATYYPTADDADAGTNGQTGDITLNANGMTPDGFFGADDSSYKLVVQDSAGSTIWTETDIRLPIRTMSIMAFGAVGDSTGAGLGTDDATAIQAAFDWLVGGNNRKLVFPSGYRFRVGSTCTANWGGGRGGQIIMESPITPDTGVGNAFELVDVRYLEAKLWVDGGGDTLVNYATADPSGAQQAFVIRGVRNGEFWVKGNDYDGRVVRVTEQGAGEEKTSRLIFHSFVTGETGSPCGQAVYCDGSTATAQFVSASWFYDAYGPYFFETHDLFFGLLEAGLWTNTGMTIEGCQSVWAPVIALGDESNTLDLLTIKGSSTPVYSGNIWIGAYFGNDGAKGLVLENIGSDTDIAGVTIDACYTRMSTEHGIYIDNCRRVKINHHSDQDEVAIETTGACKNMHIHMDTLGTGRQALIVGATAVQLNFSGSVQNANADVAASTSAVDVNSTGRDINFNHFNIETANADFAFDLVASNFVALNNCDLTLSGSTVAMGANRPKVARNVGGYRTDNQNTATISNGNSSVAVAHGLISAPQMISLTGEGSSEVASPWVSSVGTTNFTINVAANVTADRTVYWRAMTLQNQS